MRGKHRQRNWKPYEAFLKRIEGLASRGLTDEEIAHSVDYSAPWMSDNK